jgi:hypothetical protein
MQHAANITFHSALPHHLSISPRPRASNTNTSTFTWLTSELNIFRPNSSSTLSIVLTLLVLSVLSYYLTLHWSQAPSSHTKRSILSVFHEDTATGEANVIPNSFRSGLSHSKSETFFAVRTRKLFPLRPAALWTSNDTCPGELKHT